MKTKFLMMVMFAAAPAWAVNVRELSLQCSGEYRVLESRPYFEPPRGRAPGRAGTREKVLILSLDGKDCAKLEPYYGIVAEAGRPPFATREEARASLRGGLAPKDQNV